MAVSRLRLLAKQYANHDIDYGYYCDERTKLIDSIVEAGANSVTEKPIKPDKINKLNHKVKNYLLIFMCYIYFSLVFIVLISLSLKLYLFLSVETQTPNIKATTSTVQIEKIVLPCYKIEHLKESADKPTFMKPYHSQIEIYSLKQMIEMKPVDYYFYDDYELGMITQECLP